jgi:excisionase family DNA binding protein
MSSDAQVTLESLAGRLDELLVRIDAPQQRFLSVERAATYSDLSVGSVRRLIASGKLTALRPVRGKVLINKHELDAFVLSATNRPRLGRGIRR